MTQALRKSSGLKLVAVPNSKMIPENSDIIALTAQADIDRLYKKVIRPALAEFVPENGNIAEEAKNMDEFLENLESTRIIRSAMK